jgi:hypothetical protein
MSNNNDNMSSSKHLVVMDRQTGKVAWTATAEHGFRHNGTCIGNGRLYTIDRLSGPQLSKLQRRGEEPKTPMQLLVFDLKTGEKLPEPGPREVRAILLGHLENLYAFYGEHLGVRVARKHISWYSKGCVGGAVFRHAINQVESTTGQRSMIEEFFAHQADLGGKAAPAFSALPPSMAVAGTPAGLAA